MQLTESKALLILSKPATLKSCYATANLKKSLRLEKQQKIYFGCFCMIKKHMIKKNYVKINKTKNCQKFSNLLKFKNFGAFLLKTLNFAI